MRGFAAAQREYDAREADDGHELDPEAAEALADMRAEDARAYYAAFCDFDSNDILF